MLSLLAQAQTAPAPAPVPAAEEEITILPDVQVTATKDARPVREVPMNVSAVDANTVSKFNLLNVADVASVTPGLDVNTNDPRNPIPTMRGITFNPDSGTSAAVDVYWNEIAVGAPTAFRTMYDVGQIEVLRGPQGTLRGRSSPGGAITIATHKPDMNNYGASVSQQFSTEHLFNTQIMANVPILKGVLALRLAMICVLKRCKSWPTCRS